MTNTSNWCFTILQCPEDLTALNEQLNYVANLSIYGVKYSQDFDTNYIRGFLRLKKPCKLEKISTQFEQYDIILSPAFGSVRQNINYVKLGSIKWSHGDSPFLEDIHIDNNERDSSSSSNLLHLSSPISPVPTELESID